jgi:hypothetical protein
MMKEDNMKKNLLTASAIAFAYSPIALSHPGHDHSHWASDSLHIIFAASIAGVITVAAFALKKAYKKSDTQEH